MKKLVKTRWNVDGILRNLIKNWQRDKE